MGAAEAAGRVADYLRARRDRYGALYGDRPAQRPYQEREAADLLVQDVESVLHERDALLSAMNAVYRERAEFVALLTRSFESCWTYDEENPGWHIVYVDSPAGQLSWHISPADWGELFGHAVYNPEAVWDGHSTEEKYARMRRVSVLVQRKPRTS